MNQHASLVIALRKQNEALCEQLRRAEEEHASEQRHALALYQQLRKYQSISQQADLGLSSGRNRADFDAIRAIVCSAMQFNASGMCEALRHLRDAVQRVSAALERTKSSQRALPIRFEPEAAAADAGAIPSRRNEQKEHVATRDQAIQVDGQLAQTTVETLRHQLEVATQACQRLTLENQLLKEAKNEGDSPAQGKWAQLTALQRQCEMLEKVLEFAFTQ